MSAQQLRHLVFQNLKTGAGDGQDIDKFDKYCDHLLVFDESNSEIQLIGTYRLLTSAMAIHAGGFYSESEFNIEPLLARHPSLRFLELGRSCVHPDFRSKRSIEILWHGIWQYIRHHDIDVLFGCASFPGADAGMHLNTMARLYQHSPATGPWRVRAVNGRGVRLARDGDTPEGADLRSLPPLIKGYLRLGALVGEEAVVDRNLNTTDLMMVLPVADISTRYIAHYGANAERFKSQQTAPVPTVVYSN